MTYLDAFLEIKPHQREELKSVRQFIKASFEELTCFLLPHPGNFLKIIFILISKNVII